ncbi:enoyl-CoA hydratase/isomerase family protein [Pseudofrankia sp. BMG5.37]|uniref:enoyl-CoA hydratase/isomerase family protein n=1 Tax=Pseudofrankia sp. BMG5.37 TaxID=3050035 RepID=UPI002894A7DD|nr:enoyl-CoA hydratase/isomerase family protein [Pseudofrankia sp. BMG5.37]MDT3443007.1 enoyl-CoA hydratase/isomerase family protein [Pseudofrankia sp. BMG5.37]
MTALTDRRVLLERDPDTGIARITLNNPDRRNSYDATMRDQLATHLDTAATDDNIKVVLLRGTDGYFSAGADMRNAYDWYGETPTNTNSTTPNTTTTGTPPSKPRRPSQRRRLTVDRQTFGFYHQFLGYPKATIAQVEGLALGGGLEIALMADIAVVGRNTQLGMPATRFLGPALGSLHLFLHRLGPVLARRMLLTGDSIPATTLEHLGIFTETVDDTDVAKRADWWAHKISRMPADGIAIAKEAFRLIEQLQAYQGEEVLSYLLHAYGTNLTFEDGEYNFIKERARHGIKRAFQLRDQHFNIPDL